MGIYDLRFDYRNIAYFDYLPSYADPLMNIQRGFFLNENSFDIRRRMMDVQLDLRPGKRVIPYFNFNRDWNSGHGITVFQTDANEYPVSTQYGDTTNTYRGGVRIEMNRFHITLEQGGRGFRRQPDGHQCRPQHRQRHHSLPGPNSVSRQPVSEIRHQRELYLHQGAGHCASGIVARSIRAIPLQPAEERRQL